MGAGPPGSSNDPSALKSHLFFASIAWKSLWTDAAPPIEPGLVKKQHPLAQGHDRNWDDVGAAWDELVGNDEPVGDDSDGIEWSSDAEGLQRRNGRGNSTPNPHTTDIGPKDEIKLSAFPSVHDSARSGSVSNGPSRDDSSSSSPGSSSGNPVDGLRDSMERLGIRSSGRSSPDGPARRDAIRLEIERGRDRAPTPLRNNEPDPPDLLVLAYFEALQLKPIPL